MLVCFYIWTVTLKARDGHLWWKGKGSVHPSMWIHSWWVGDEMGWSWNGLVLGGGPGWAHSIARSKHEINTKWIHSRYWTRLGSKLDRFADTQISIKNRNPHLNLNIDHKVHFNSSNNLRWVYYMWKWFGKFYIILWVTCDKFNGHHHSNWNEKSSSPLR